MILTHTRAPNHDDACRAVSEPLSLSFALSFTLSFSGQDGQLPAGIDISFDADYSALLVTFSSDAEDNDNGFAGTWQVRVVSSPCHKQARLAT